MHFFACYIAGVIVGINVGLILRPVILSRELTQVIVVIPILYQSARVSYLGDIAPIIVGVVIGGSHSGGRDGMGLYCTLILRDKNRLVIMRAFKLVQKIVGYLIC